MSMLCIIVSMNFWPTQGGHDPGHSANADQRQAEKAKEQRAKATNEANNQAKVTPTITAIPTDEPSTIAQIPCDSSSSNSSAQNGSNSQANVPPVVALPSQGTQTYTPPSQQGGSTIPPYTPGNTGGTTPSYTPSPTGNTGGTTPTYTPTTQPGSGTPPGQSGSGTPYTPGQNNVTETPTYTPGQVANRSDSSYTPGQYGGDQQYGSDQQYPPVQATPTAKPVSPPNAPVVQKPSRPSAPATPEAPEAPASPSIVASNDSYTPSGDTGDEATADNDNNEDVPSITSRAPSPMPSIEGTPTTPDVESPSYWPDDEESGDEIDYEIPRVYWSYHGGHIRYWPVSCQHATEPVVPKTVDTTAALWGNVIFIFGGSFVATTLLLGSAYLLKRRQRKAMAL
ncbi:hypothetical protein [Ktedonospora formicarum]|nr:hypothetical protein [Ktedonospora formicarum]